MLIDLTKVSTLKVSEERERISGNEIRKIAIGSKENQRRVEIIGQCQR